MIPYTVILNLLMLGACSVSTTTLFFRCFGFSLLYFCIIYMVFGFVALIIRRNFPADHELFRRIAVMLPVFYILNLLSTQTAYLLYEKNGWVGCSPLRSMQWWVFSFSCIASTILTLLNEASAGWEQWKASVTETSRLQNAYQKSRLLILKRQINPHFLFNCFNTLSSLIQEDAEEAERFLDELTKVYRYLLQGDEQKLVKLEDELRFMISYLYLGKTRFGSALQVDIQVRENMVQLKMAPLTLQVVLENIIYSNAFSKDEPLFIRISDDDRRRLIIGNNEQPKKLSEASDQEEALDDLVKKYRLLCKPGVEILETEGYREVIVPLIEKEEVFV